MPYEPDLDKKVFYETKEFENTRLGIGIFSYNNGEKKLQLSRENIDQTGEWRFAKLGRMTKEEVEAIIPLMQSALEHME